MICVICFYCGYRDYISPTILRIEFGLANELKQLESSDKLKKILGSPVPKEINRSMFSSAMVKNSMSRSAASSAAARSVISATISDDDDRR